MDTVNNNDNIKFYKNENYKKTDIINIKTMLINKLEENIEKIENEN